MPKIKHPKVRYGPDGTTIHIDDVRSMSEDDFAAVLFSFYFADEIRSAAYLIGDDASEFTTWALPFLHPEGEA
jgi:hypothetical protein